jgi:hypothetical protein
MRRAVWIVIAVVAALGGCEKTSSPSAHTRPTAADDQPTGPSKVSMDGDKPPTKVGGQSQRDVAKLIAHELAYEAFPMWAMQHPDKQCPEQLAELGEFMSGGRTLDPWGHAYVMYCGASLPAGAKGIAFRSLGPDGKPDTADDITSWE